MKKYFCYHCQEEVTPYGITCKKLRWLFCPKCLRRITDDGSGFYRICDYCGANIAPDAAACPKCGYIFDGQALAEQEQADFVRKIRFYDVVLGIALLCTCFVVAFALFYISFYILIFLGIAWILNWLFHKVRSI